MDKYRGHEIILVNNIWVYKDTLEAVSENKDRACAHCGLENTEDGHDGCLKELPGVMNACCGHGNDDEAYVQFTSGVATAMYSAAAACYIGYLKKEGIK